MAIKTGFSHSLATLLLTIVSALLIYFLKDVGVFSQIFSFLLDISFRLSVWIERTQGVSINYELIPVVIVAGILAFIWGVIYHISRK